VADALHHWLSARRQKVPEGSATAKANDYSLKRSPDPADRAVADRLAVSPDR
jgi:hypothetical protein